MLTVERARSESIFCGIWRVRCQNDNGQWEEHLEAGSAPRALWLAATFNTLPDDSLLPRQWTG